MVSTQAVSNDVIRTMIKDIVDKPGALLPVLHRIQDKLGYIPESVVPLVASELNLSRADVHGVITFYHHFRSHPKGQHVVSICRAEACQSMHCEQLEEHVKQQLAIDYHETTEDGKFTLEPVYCLGNCACSPAMMIDDEIYGRVSPDRFNEILTELSERND